MLQKDNEYTKATFWKCALQVNPFSYSHTYKDGVYNGSEDDYYQELLKVAQENDIKILGITNHGSVSEIEKIRQFMEPKGIIIFPGFEIASSEKIHFVCLYPETTSIAELNRYLGALGMTDPEKCTDPSIFSGNQIIDKVEEQGGFIFAAHSTSKSGILFGKNNNIWVNQGLRAAQIPCTLDNLKETPTCQNYYQILTNKNPEYKREQKIALINAKDVSIPSDLADPVASCLIRMTNPCFQAFKDAFLDVESRIRLNSDKHEKYTSSILAIKITGGYLDGLDIQFSNYLNTIIGGRGTGKSTLIESIRYAFDLHAIGDDAQRTHEAIIKENLGKAKGLVEVLVTSAPMQGGKYTISRCYGERPIVKDEKGTITTLKPLDVIPAIEIFGQNEIYEITQDQRKQNALIYHFVTVEDASNQNLLKEIAKQLEDNRKKIIKTKEEISNKEDQLETLSKLNEQLHIYEQLGVADKLKVIPLLEKEKALISRIDEECSNLDLAFSSVTDNSMDLLFLSDSVLSGLPQALLFGQIKKQLEELSKFSENLVSQWNKGYKEHKESLVQLKSGIFEAIKSQELELDALFKNIPESRGKTGKEIGIDYQRVVKEIERITPQKAELKTKKTLLDELALARRQLLHEKSVNKAHYNAQYDKAIANLNKRTQGKLRIFYYAESDRTKILDFLISCRLPNVSSGRLAWIQAASDFSVVELVRLIRERDVDTIQSKWGVTPSVANALLGLDYPQLLELEELESFPMISIELNVAHGDEEIYKSLDSLSKGQKCTAILALLLIENEDPLVLDQPEDNLDNAFIADRIVSELRKNKLNRQFIFATHNANIPVFGDAEWIGVFSADSSHGSIPKEQQGAIDSVPIKKLAASILEGGKEAFLQRKAKYGI